MTWTASRPSFPAGAISAAYFGVKYRRGRNGSAHQQAMFLFAVSGVYDAVISTHEPDVDSVREYRLLRYLFRRYAVQRPPGWAYPPLWSMAS